MRKPITLLLALLGLTAFAGPATFEIVSHQFTGGGGRSSGEAFNVTGSINTHGDAPVLTGGNFSLEPGFWATYTTVPMGDAPALTITVAGNTVQVRWPLSATGYNLEESAQVGPNASWSSVANSPTTSGLDNLVTFTIAPGTHFLRLRNSP